MNPNSLEFSDDSLSHPSAEQMAAYLEGRLARAEHDAVVDHLCDCPACRLEARDARALHVGVRRTRRPLWITIASTLAAGLLFMIVPTLRSPPAPSTIERNTDTRIPADAIPRIDVLAPGSEGELSARGLKFQWRAESVDVEYSMSLQDSSGHIVWSATTADTTLTLPADVTVRPGLYFWTVDALRADGRTATTGTQRLRIK
jgi:hypothetical protein